MLVFGDAGRRIVIEERFASLRERAGRCAAAKPDDAGAATRGEIAEAFIEAAEVAQGLVDADFDACGEDRETAMSRSLTAMVGVFAQALLRCWTGQDPLPFARFEEALAGLPEQDWPDSVVCKWLEGYAFYALYPESYLDAALGSRGAEPLTIVGIRSIGLGLAALVAAARGAKPPVTVRPVGHPFRRELSLSHPLASRLREARGDFAVVDEGPGLSGSSFGAVLDVLEAHGRSRRRLHVFPSHAGDLGHEASPAHRRRWSEVSRHVVDFDALFLTDGAPDHHLNTWFADVTGDLSGPVQDLSGGAWRALRFGSASAWPPANVQQERRKYLLRAPSGAWLMKFSGLGPYGREKLPWAAALAQAGFIPPVRAFRHGFHLEPWLEDHRPVETHAEREKLIAHLAAYLGFRAAHLSAPPQAGASLVDLAAMLRHNAGLVFGRDLDGDLEVFARQAPALETGVRRVVTDNRLHAWEWLKSPDGRIVKTDALDHAAAHDLVGCQDIAWDVAGAAAEFDLSAEECRALIRQIAMAAGHSVDGEVLRFLKPCYLAFQLGAATMARDSLGGAPDEAGRLASAAANYRRRLAAALRGLL